jgi:hypothetical protein
MSILCTVSILRCQSRLREATAFKVNFNWSPPRSTFQDSPFQRPESCSPKLDQLLAQQLSRKSQPQNRSFFVYLAARIDRATFESGRQSPGSAMLVGWLTSDCFRYETSRQAVLCRSSTPSPFTRASECGAKSLLRLNLIRSPKRSDFCLSGDLPSMEKQLPARTLDSFTCRICMSTCELVSLSRFIHLPRQTGCGVVLGMYHLHNYPPQAFIQKQILPNLSPCSNTCLPKHYRHFKHITLRLCKNASQNKDLSLRRYVLESLRLAWMVP